MKKTLFLTFFLLPALLLGAENYKVLSPDGKIALNVVNDKQLTYSVDFDGATVVGKSAMGFEFVGEKPMSGNFSVINSPAVVSGVEQWTPVVKNKHAEVSVGYNALTLALQEKDGQYRKMDVEFRVMNDGVAFRYTLYGTPVLGARQVSRELTTYAIPSGSDLWIPDFAYDSKHPYKSSQEGVFRRTPISSIESTIHAGLPGLIEINPNSYLAITEAYLDNFPAFYLGHSTSTKGYDVLNTKLTPMWGENEDGVKARFSENQSTSWRVIMVADTPGRFIESEILQSLNPPCAVADAREWVKPGMCAWDHWWSGECKMEQPVIEQYIDLAAAEGWPYMLIDWTWYGPYCVPSADITKPAPQLDMPAIIKYAADRNVKIWLWLRCEDANQNDAYKEAFALYHEWGVVGVKIDFMDRDDQDMVNWYRRICKATAENHLMLDFHGAYKPDGIERTYPNLLTREGVLGNENYKWSDEMSPEHNVTLAFTRMIAGPMDYTPGGFLNVTQQEYRHQSPTLVANTRAAELAKFVVYESPYQVVCDHPDNILGQPGADFLSEVSTTWDDTRFLGGHPEEYVALARRCGDKWFIGVLGNSQKRELVLDLSEIIPDGTYTVTSWQDAKDSDRVASHVDKKASTLPADRKLKVTLAPAGGYVAIIEKKNTETMTFAELAKERYSCKKFDSSRQISQEQLDVILEAGRVAPTAKNLQEQHVYVLQSAEALAMIDKNTPCRYGAPTCLVVAFNKKNVFVYPGGKRDSGVEDATIVATHMMLAAQSVGVNSCWLNYFEMDKLAADLGLPEDEEILMIMDLGFAAEGAGPLSNHFSRKPLEETVTYLK